MNTKAKNYQGGIAVKDVTEAKVVMVDNVVSPVVAAQIQALTPSFADCGPTVLAQALRDVRPPTTHGRIL